MLALLTKTLKTIIDMLPAAVARLLLLLALVGALTLHLKASQRIRMLEDADGALRQADALLAEQNRHILEVMTDLTDEVRGYRQDMREENKALRAQARAAVRAPRQN